ncbi:sensor histidine kinase, partial [bacterium]|nr:sensor histidine kinase [bacterium]
WFDAQQKLLSKRIALARGDLDNIVDIDKAPQEELIAQYASQLAQAKEGVALKEKIKRLATYIEQELAEWSIQTELEFISKSQEDLIALVNKAEYLTDKTKENHINQINQKVAQLEQARTVQPEETVEEVVTPAEVDVKKKVTIAQIIGDVFDGALRPFNALHWEIEEGVVDAIIAGLGLKQKEVSLTAKQREKVVNALELLKREFPELENKELSGAIQKELDGLINNPEELKVVEGKWFIMDESNTLKAWVGAFLNGPYVFILKAMIKGATEKQLAGAILHELLEVQGIEHEPAKKIVDRFIVGEEAIEERMEKIAILEAAGFKTTNQEILKLSIKEIKERIALLNELKESGVKVSIGWLTYAPVTLKEWVEALVEMGITYAQITSKLIIIQSYIQRLAEGEDVGEELNNKIVRLSEQPENEQIVNKLKGRVQQLIPEAVEKVEDDIEEIKNKIKSLPDEEKHYIPITISDTKDVKFLLTREDYAAGMKVSEGGMLSLLSKALSLEKELYFGIYYEPLNEEIVLSLLDQPHYFSEEHGKNGFIGINKSIVEIKDEKIRNIVLIVALMHELRYEVTGRDDDAFEQEQLAWDIQLTLSLLNEEGILLDDYIKTLGLLDKETPYLRGLQQFPYKYFVEVLSRTFERDETIIGQIFDNFSGDINFEKLTENIFKMIKELETLTDIEKTDLDKYEKFSRLSLEMLVAIVPALKENCQQLDRVIKGKVKPAKVDIIELVDSVIEANKISNVNVLLPEGDNLPQIEGFSDYIEQTLVELITNANEHGARNIEVTILKAIHPQTREEGIQIKIKDDGRGINSEDQKNIFNKGFRGDVEVGEGKKITGTGLGLHYAKRFIEELYRGDIRVSSEGRDINKWEAGKGNGSTFNLTLFDIDKERDYQEYRYELVVSIIHNIGNNLTVLKESAAMLYESKEDDKLFLGIKNKVEDIITYIKIFMVMRDQTTLKTRLEETWKEEPVTEKRFPFIALTSFLVSIFSVFGLVGIAMAESGVVTNVVSGISLLGISVPGIVIGGIGIALGVLGLRWILKRIKERADKERIKIEAPPVIEKLSNEEAGAIVNNAAILSNKERAYNEDIDVLPVKVRPKEMRELLKSEVFRPKYQYKIGKYTIYLSNSYKSDKITDRESVVAYIKSPDGKIVIRSFYCSLSLGLWHSASHFGQPGSPLWIGKGMTAFKFSTQLPIQMQKVLFDIRSQVGFAQEVSGEEAKKVFYGALQYLIPTEYEKELEGISEGIRDMIRDVPESRKVLDSQKGMHIKPEDLKIKSKKLRPDFSKLITRFEVRLNPELYKEGIGEAYVFYSKDKKLQYLFLRDTSGNVWLGTIDFIEEDINNFGIRRVMYNPLDLSKPPYEYYDNIPEGYIGERKSGSYYEVINYHRNVSILNEAKKVIEERSKERTWDEWKNIFRGEGVEIIQMEPVSVDGSEVLTEGDARRRLATYTLEIDADKITAIEKIFEEIAVIEKYISEIKQKNVKEIAADYKSWNIDKLENKLNEILKTGKLDDKDLDKKVLEEVKVNIDKIKQIKNSI